MGSRVSFRREDPGPCRPPAENLADGRQPVRHESSPVSQYVPLSVASGRTERGLERAKGFEPSTSTLARLRSTPELRPRVGPKKGPPIELHRQSAPAWQYRCPDGRRRATSLAARPLDRMRPFSHLRPIRVSGIGAE